MDANYNANYINSVGSGNEIPCPNCGKLNRTNSNFCIACGTKITDMSNNTNTDSAFNPIQEPTQSASDETVQSPSEIPFQNVTEEPAEAPFQKVTEEPAKTPFQDVAEEPNETPFQVVAEEPNETPIQAVTEKPAVAPVASKYVEPESVFAKGLPQWTLEPPQVLVRRH